MNLKCGWLVVVALGASVVGCSGAPADDSASTSTANVDPSSQPANFFRVRDGLFRGGHPDQAGLEYLQSIGVTTIVDLEIGDLIEATPWEISQEESQAKAMGFNFIREPLSAFQPFVSTAEMQSTLNILSDPSNGTVYVHCKHGQDRTGMVIGLERVFTEGWAPADAYAEMIAHGFHPEFLGLKHFFDEQTGYDD
jgi:protein tyrosine/serine phosphatase